jgi:hypothetical protein
MSKQEPPPHGPRERFLEQELFLEEVFESLARIHGPRRRRRRSTGRRGLRVRRGRGIFFHGGAKFIKLAIVLYVFGRDALGYGLRTFKLRASIEKAALLAGMQFELTLGTGPVGVKTRREDGAAIRASRTRDGADHARSARAELIRPARAA